MNFTDQFEPEKEMEKRKEIGPFDVRMIRRRLLADWNFMMWGGSCS